MVKRVAVIVLLLALVGVAACGDEQPDQPASEGAAVDIPSWPPPLPANALVAEREECAALRAEAADRGFSVTRGEVEAFWWGIAAQMKAQGAELADVVRAKGVTREHMAYAGWRSLIFDKMREQEGMTARDEGVAAAQQTILASRIVQKRRR